MFRPNFPALEEDWREVLALNPRAVVFFWAVWSPPDKMLSAVLERVAPQFDSHFAFFAADLDDENIWPLAVEIGILTNPALVWFQHGQARERIIGYATEAALRQKLGEWLALG